MDTIQIILLAVFAVAAVVGYFIINRVPSLLHTPLMSGTNALSGDHDPRGAGHTTGGSPYATTPMAISSHARRDPGDDQRRRRIHRHRSDA